MVTQNVLYREKCPDAGFLGHAVVGVVGAVVAWLML